MHYKNIYLMYSEINNKEWTKWNAHFIAIRAAIRKQYTHLYAWWFKTAPVPQIQLNTPSSVQMLSSMVLSC